MPDGKLIKGQLNNFFNDRILEELESRGISKKFHVEVMSGGVIRPRLLESTAARLYIKVDEEHIAEALLGKQDEVDINFSYSMGTGILRAIAVNLQAPTPPPP